MSYIPNFSWLATDGTNLTLESWPLDPESVLSGSPQTFGQMLWASEDNKQQCGIWEITPGSVKDVESAEMIVILAGKATVTKEDGSSIELYPGVVAFLPAGTKTVWHVRERLRKAFYLVKNVLG